MGTKTSILGINRRVIVFIHKLMLVGMLHSTLVAPSQIMLNDYFQRGEYKKYFESNNNSRLSIDIADEDAQEEDVLTSSGKGVSHEKTAQQAPYVDQNASNNNMAPAVNNTSRSFVIAADIKEGVIGRSTERPLDDARDNIFKFNVPALETESYRAYLTYELSGLAGTGVSTMINHRYASGGYMVKQEQGWSAQKEEIDVNWLKNGENIIMFSAPKGSGVAYQVKNVKIEFEKLNEGTIVSPLAVNTPEITLSKNDKVYVKGFIRNRDNSSIKVYAEDNALTVTDGVFEGFITLTDEAKKRQFIVVKVSDATGFLGQDIIFLNALAEADQILEIESTLQRASAVFNKDNEGELAAEGAKIIVNKDALSEDKTLSIAKLRSIDVAPLNSGMINVTKGGSAYRFLPDGIKFKNAVKIALDYDEKLLPAGYTAKDIKTFYFDTNRKSWIAVQRDTTAVNGNTITSLTDHFSDYINGIIQAPESPETAGFTPTMMNDIKAADPSAEMTIISPPEVSQKGDANVSFPIKIPAGRNGMQPQLAVQYNSEGGSGWLGQGWDISIPALTIDTRWGTPQLDPVNESEMYMLNGEQLMYEDLDGSDWMPNRHYEIEGSTSTVYSTQSRPRITNAVFTPRKQGSFTKIERLGTNPTNYYWKVTTTDGTIHWYGGKNGVNPNAVIKTSNNAAGKILHWSLYMTEDVHGNTILYEYIPQPVDSQNPGNITGLTGLNQNLNGGTYFKIKKIKYTGYNNAANSYGYEVIFNTSGTVRTDATINGRLGVKEVDPYFLNNIVIKKVNQTNYIRKYKFETGYGKFKKGRLNAIAEVVQDENGNDKEFYRHTFDYYDDLAQDGQDVYFGAVVTQTICNDVPPAPCPDSDNDGVCDSQDLCPTEPGPATNVGCPEQQFCFETSFAVPNSIYYKYSGHPGHIWQYSSPNLLCRTSSWKQVGYQLGTSVFDALSYSIFVIHGQGTDPTISRCPSGPITTTPDYSIENPDYLVRSNNFRSAFFANYNYINPYNQSLENFGYVQRISDQNGVPHLQNYAKLRHIFYSSQDLNIKDIWQLGYEISTGNLIWAPQSVYDFVKAQMYSYYGAQVFINNSTTPIGTFNLTQFSQINQLQSLLAASYPGTTVTQVAQTSSTPYGIQINTTNGALASVKIVPVNTGIANTYNLTECNTGRPASVVSNDWAGLEPTQKDIEYSINRSRAEGRELEQPLANILYEGLVTTANQENKNEEYFYRKNSNDITWYNLKGETLTDNYLLLKLNTEHKATIDEEYTKLNEQDHKEEIEKRQKEQLEAIKWLEQYEKEEQSNVQEQEVNEISLGTFRPKNGLTNNGSTNYFQQLLNNYSIGFISAVTGNPDCPTFINGAFIVPGQIPSFVSAGAILGSSRSENVNFGGHFGVGIDFAWDITSKNITIGGGGNYSYDNSESLTALVDLNGDGLDDLVFKQNGVLFWKKHIVNRTYDSNNQPVVTHSFGPHQLIFSFQSQIHDFYKSNGSSSSWNLQVNFGFSGVGGFAGYESSSHNSRTNIYFTDANADGLMDIVKHGIVYFNRANGAEQYFEPQSLNTENMLIVAAPVTITPPLTEVETNTPNFDVVKVWEAPADGTIKIENNIVSTDTSRETVVTIETKKAEEPCYKVEFDAPALIDTNYNYHSNPGFWFYYPYSQPHPLASLRIDNITVGSTVYPVNLYVTNGSSSGCLNQNPPFPFPTSYVNPGAEYINHRNINYDPQMELLLQNIFGANAEVAYTENASYIYNDTGVNQQALILQNHLGHCGFHFDNDIPATVINYSRINSCSSSNIITDSRMLVMSSAVDYTVGLNTTVSINGTSIGMFNIHNNFNQFKNAFEAQYPGSSVELNTQTTPSTVIINTNDPNLNTITLQHSSLTNSYDFIPCEDNFLRPSEVKKDWTDARPSKIEKNISYKKYLAEGKELTTPIMEQPMTLIVEIDEAKNGVPADVYVIDIESKQCTWKNSKGEIISDKNLIYSLNGLLPVDIKQQYQAFQVSYHKEEVKRRIEARDKAIAELQEITQKNYRVKSGQTSNTCTTSPGETCLLFGTKLNSTTPSVTNVITTTNTECNPEGGALTVRKGDKIYFRVHSVTNGNPAVEWNPKVSYTNSTMLATNDQNGIPVYTSTYNDGFILSQNAPTVFPGNGTAKIMWDSFTVTAPTDDVKFKITQRVANGPNYTDTVIYEKNCAANANTSVSPTAALSNITVGGTTAAQVTQFLFQVTSTSNVNWKAIEWKPKMICTTVQPIVATPNGPSDGNLTTNEMKYPIVDYSIYTPYLCGVPYTTINISQMNGGSGLSIAPNLPANLFANSDSGIIHFVVKQGNDLIGKNAVAVVNGQVYGGGAVPITGSGPIEVGYYTDDSNRVINSPTDVSLLQRIVNAGTVATITGPSVNNNVSSAQVNLYHKKRSLTGPMYRQWGQFMYNAEAATGGIAVPSLGVNLLNEELLTFSNTQATALQNALLDGNSGPGADLLALQNIDLNSPTGSADMLAALQNISNNAGYNNMPFMTANPSRDYENGAFIDKWIGMHPECYSNATGARAAFMSQIFSFGGDSNTSQDALNTGAYAIDKLTEGGGESVSGGGGFGGFGASGTASVDGDSDTLSDYIDLNGDRYPDPVAGNSVQYTLKTGGLYAFSSRGMFGGNIAEDNSTSSGFTASGTFSKSGKPAAGGDGATPQATGKTKTGKPDQQATGGGNNSTAISGSFGGGTANTAKLFADINGDGLPDILYKDGSIIRVHLNIGTTTAANQSPFNNFNGNNAWGSFELGTGSSENIGGGAGFNYANEAISAGVSLGRTDSDTDNALIDFNGDGLVDKISSSGSSISVDYNTGNKFMGTPVTISAFSLHNSASATTAGLNGTITSSIIWPLYLLVIVIPLKVPDVSVTVAGGTSTNRTQKSIVDFDGDGYPDIVEEVDANTVKISHSRIRRTDKLKTVYNPLGGKFTIDYEVQPVSYSNPSAKWTMKSVVIEDGYDKVNDGEDVYRKEFVYENGKYDRREREFYGYETIKTVDYLNDSEGEPSTVYRTSVSKYHNKSYFLNGLLKEAYVIKGSDINMKYSRTINDYEIKKLANNNSELVPTSVLPETFDVGGREGRRTAAVVLTRTTTELYELNSSPQIISQTEMKYDGKGRIVEYKYLGDLATTNDDYTTVINYHNLANNIISVPAEMKVMVDTTEVRKRTTTVIPSTGKIDKIMAHLDNTNIAQTVMQYDIYGNLEVIEFPANANGEIMFRTFTYDTEFNKYVVTIEDAMGYSSHTEYNSDFDKIALTTDMAGNMMKYEYDRFGRNTAIIAPKELEAGKPYTIKFSYYPKFTDIQPLGTGITASNFVPVALTQHYDVQHPENDIETITFMDGLARPIQVKKDIELNKDENHQSADYFEAMSISGKAHYDEFGRTTKQFHPYYETKSFVSKFMLNEYNSAINPAITVYDEADRPVETIDPDQNSSFMLYSVEQDPNGVMAIKTRSVVPQSSSQYIVTDTFKDISGKVTSTVNQGAQTIVTQFRYNAINELMEYEDAQGRVTKYEYDKLGRKRWMSHPDNGITTFKHDLSGNLTHVQTANLAVDDTYIEYLYYFIRPIEVRFPNNPDGSDNISNVKYDYGTPAAGNDTGRLVYQSDATGEQEFKYGNMGEVVYNRRTVVGPTPSMPIRVFETHFDYDSFNRIMSLTYPDGEKVSYGYDWGGNLNRMTGEYNHNPYNYIERLDYDHYEQRAYLLYGNKTETYYNYTPTMRRMDNLQVKTADSQDLYNNNYGYDFVGNVTSLQNTAGPTANYMGGTYSHTFTYDNFNRLSTAQGIFEGSGYQAEIGSDYYSDYTLDMVYNNTHGIESKTQYHFKNSATVTANTYENNYTYYEDTHRLHLVTDNNTGNVEEFAYDNNGNIIKRYDTQGNSRDMNWDESNRLRVVFDGSSNGNINGLQHYIYDAGGERVLKANSDVQQTYQNGTMVDPSVVTINNYTTYPSGYLVIDGHGVYSKHYYAGTERIVSRIGDESYDYFDANNLAGKGVTEELKEKRQAQVRDLNLILKEAKLGKARFKEFKPYTYEEIKLELEEEALDNAGSNDFDNAMTAMSAPPEDPIYYYHPDHLGTSTFLTDFNGVAYQFFLNLPFGETMAEQLPTGYYQTPYKFNGKELDEETGMYYYGARYYDPKISIWMSTDPLMEKYPDFNPYVYCYQNPINIIDPTGMEGVGKEDWYRDKQNILQYDPEVKSQADLGSKGTYVGKTHKEKTSRGGTAEYREDGSIVYSNEKDAYQRIWTNTFARQREQFAVIGEKSVIVLPDYENGIASSYFAEYGYKFQNGNLLDSCSGKEFETLATIHVHPAGSGPSTYTVDSWGDAGFASFNTPYKPAFVFQNNTEQTISFIIGGYEKGMTTSQIPIAEGNVTRDNPELNGRSIRKDQSLRRYIKNVNWKAWLKNSKK